MLNENDLNQIRTQSAPEDINKLINEVERLQKYVQDYSASVNKKVDEIEAGMNELQAENARLLSLRESASVERDACIGLLLQLAISNGYRAGIAPGNIVAVDLPSGQVSWEFGVSEAHLFANLPAYPDAIQELEIAEKYSRIMNPGIGF